MRADLLPLVQGNIRHVAEVRGTARELDIEHREWVLCLGRGFDWLHMPNQALIIGPYSPDLADPVRNAEIGVDRARRTQVTLPVRLCSRSHHPRVSATGRKNAPQDSGAELGQPASGMAEWRLSRPISTAVCG